MVQWTPHPCPPTYLTSKSPTLVGLKFSNVLIKLENADETLIQWFEYNRMKANTVRYNFIYN